MARPSKKPQPESRADVRAGSKDSGAARGKPGRKKTKKKIAKKAAKKKVAKKRTASRGVEDFARGLAETERIALIVRDELFSGSWENMRKDLEARAAGRPYVFRLASRIDEDLKAVEKLSAFERRRKVNLSEFLREGQ